MFTNMNILCWQDTMQPVQTLLTAIDTCSGSTCRMTHCLIALSQSKNGRVCGTYGSQQKFHLLGGAGAIAQLLADKKAKKLQNFHGKHQPVSFICFHVSITSAASASSKSFYHGCRHSTIEGHPYRTIKEKRLLLQGVRFQHGINIVLTRWHRA